MAKISYMLINLGLFITSNYISPVFFDAFFHFLASTFRQETSKKVEDRVKEHRRNIITGNEQS